MRRGRFASDITRQIKEVFQLQIETLARLQQGIDGCYEKAVRTLLRCRGKVIVTGVGKSGIVAQKIAATLSSTGTPAIYLHSSEGMHGHLGIVQKGDVVIAIGKSGESEELTGLLPSIKKIGAEVIAITANKESSLARYAAVTLHTPIEKESCPLNLAPTCSTTAAMVVGDGLAVALMKQRGFKPETFALYHPGGQLGKRLTLRVADLMRGGTDNPAIHVKSGTRAMLREITSKRTGAVSIVDDKNRLLGLVTDYDIRRVVERGENILQKKIRDIMNPKPTSVYSNERAVKALEIMENRDKPISVLPVLNRRKMVIGMIHLHDLLAKGL
jgi:arabinose-5-phosphate isomerase